MVFLMQSGLDTVNPETWGRDRAGTAQPKERIFSLTPLPDTGLTVRRTTSLFHTDVEYYIQQKTVASLKKSDFLVRLEKEVLLEKKQSLKRRCDADTYNYRARALSDTPDSCVKFKTLANALGKG